MKTQQGSLRIWWVVLMGILFRPALVFSRILHLRDRPGGDLRGHWAGTEPVDRVLRAVILGARGLFCPGGVYVGLPDHWGGSFLVALPAAGAAGAVMAYLVGIPVLRLRLIFLAISTVGLGIITHDVLYNLKGFTGGADGMTVPKPKLGPLVFKSDESFFYIVAVVVIFLSFLLGNITRTKAGRAFLAIRESERAATAAGIDVPRYKMLAFVISAFYTGVAGGLYAHLTAYINVTAFDILLSVTFLSMIIIGGVASIPGSILGAIFVVVVPEALRDVPGAKDIQALVYGLLMGFFIIFLPGGLVSGFSRLKGIFKK